MQTRESPAWATFPEDWTAVSNVTARTLIETSTASTENTALPSTRLTAVGFTSTDRTEQNDPLSGEQFRQIVTWEEHYGFSTQSTGATSTNDYTRSTVSNNSQDTTYGATGETRSTSSGRTFYTNDTGTTTAETTSDASTILSDTGTQTASGTASTGANGAAKTSTATEDQTATRTVPSTTSTQTQTGAATSDTTSTKTCTSSLTFTETTNNGTSTATTDSWTYSVTTTTGDSTSTVTTTANRWAPQPATLLFRDYNLPDVWNGERVWTLAGFTSAASIDLSAQTAVGVFTDFWSSVLDSVATVTVAHPQAWTNLSAEHRTFAYSSSSSTRTDTTDTGAGTETVTVTDVDESLNAVAWDSTEAKSTSTVTLNSNHTATSLTAQESGYDVTGAWTTGTVSISGDTGFTQEWNTWWWSEARTDTTTLLSSAAETILIQSNQSTATDGYLSMGLVTTTSEALVSTSTTYAWTNWLNARTRTVMRFSATEALTGANFGAGTTSSYQDTYGATTHAQSSIMPSFIDPADFGYSAPPWVRFAREPIGFLGFGGGWSDTTAPVHFTVTKTLASGSEFASWTIDTNWPAGAIRPGASAFRTDYCGISSYFPAAARSVSWTGTGTAGSLLVTWTSTTTTGTATSDTANTSTAATYNVGVSQAITGDFASSTVATVQNDATIQPLHRPTAWGLERVTFGGEGAITASSQTLQLPAGAFSYTQGDSTSTTAGSSSSAAGPWEISFDGTVSVTGWFAPAKIRQNTVGGAGAAWTTALRFSEDNS